MTIELKFLAKKLKGRGKTPKKKDLMQIDVRQHHKNAFGLYSNDAKTRKAAQNDIVKREQAVIGSIATKDKLGRRPLASDSYKLRTARVKRWDEEYKREPSVWQVLALLYFTLSLDIATSFALPK
jgi:hypothetical protein